MIKNNIAWTNEGFGIVTLSAGAKRKGDTVNDDIKNDPQSRLLVRTGTNGTQVDYWLSDNITEMSNYVDLLKAIETLTESDQIVLHINCYGGYIDTANQIRTALAMTPASVCIRIEGMCASAATFFFTVANEVTLAPNTIFMLHSYSGGSYGKFHEQMAQADFMKKWFNEFVKDVYKDLLTDDEIQKLLDGKDLYFTKDEFIDHVANMIQVKRDAMEEEDTMFDELNAELDRVQADFIAHYKKKKEKDKDMQNEILPPRKKTRPVKKEEKEAEEEAPAEKKKTRKKESK